MGLQKQNKIRNKKKVTVVIAMVILLLVVVAFIFSSPPQVDEDTDLSPRPVDGIVMDLVNLRLETTSSDPQIAVYGNITYVVWKDNSTGNDEIFLKVSEAGKADSDRVFNLSRSNGSSTDPQIAVYGNSTYVVWKDDSDGNDEIFMKVSEAGKAEFGRLINLSRDNGSSTDPQIAVYGNGTYVVWKDDSDGNDEIFMKVSEAGKAKFGRLINLSRNNASSTDPQVAVYGNSTYVVWEDNSTGNDEIFLKVSEAGKAEFGRLINLSRDNGTSTDPQIVVYGNGTYVVWKDDSDGNDEIFMKVSEAGKAKFGRLLNLSRNNGTSTDPQIAVNGYSIYAVWKDDSNGTTDILFDEITGKGFNIGK